MVNKTELIALLEGPLGSRAAAVTALDSVLGEIQRAVVAGERVTLTGFGTFERVERPAHTGRNPRTGAAIEIAASASPRFHAGSALRAAVAGTTSGTPAEPGPAKPVRRARAASPAKAASPANTVKTVDATAPVKPARPVKPAKGGKKHHADAAAAPAKAAKPGKRSSSAKPAKASAGKKKKK